MCCTMFLTTTQGGSVVVKCSSKEMAYIRYYIYNIYTTTTLLHPVCFTGVI